MAMTEEEKRIARNEASKRCRLKKLAAMKKPLKKQQVKEKPVRKNKACSIEKLERKYGKTVATVKSMLSDVADMLEGVYADGDEKLCLKTLKRLQKSLSVYVNQPDDPSAKKPKATVCFMTPGKAFAVPRIEAPVSDDIDAGTLQHEEDVVAEQDSDEETTEIVVDPDVAKAIAEGDKYAADIMPESDDEDNESDDDEDDDDEDDDSDIDESELTDDEREERKWAEEEALEDDYNRGRWEALSEFNAMGMGEED